MNSYRSQDNYSGIDCGSCKINTSPCFDSRCKSCHYPYEKCDSCNCSCCNRPCPAGATGATGATGSTGTTPTLNYLQANTATAFGVPVGGVNATFTTTTAISGTDITFTPPSSNITLAAGHTYQVCTSAGATIPANSGLSSSLKLNGVIVPGSFISTTNSGTLATGGNLASCTIVTGPGTLNVLFNSQGNASTINNANINVVEVQ